MNFRDLPVQVRDDVPPNTFYLQSTYNTFRPYYPKVRGKSAHYWQREQCRRVIFVLTKMNSFNITARREGQLLDVL